MADQREREQRVANGSRRKRDLAAVEGDRFSVAAFAAEHFPTDDPVEAGLARLATFHVWARHHRRKVPDVPEVRQRIEELREQRARFE